MRLWHYKLIPYLPKSQLLAQWRELNSIFKKRDRHILINYIYDYPKTDLLYYTRLVIDEMGRRRYKIKSFEKSDAYFANVSINDHLAYFPADNPDFHPFEVEHDEGYLLICYFNLLEKFLRGQKDFSGDCFDRMRRFVSSEIGNSNPRRYV